MLHFGDLTDSSGLARIVEQSKPDEVYNLGAQSHVKISFEQSEYTADVVGLGSLRLLEAIRAHRDRSGQDTRFYQASSSEMFGSAPPPQSMQTPFHPRNPYGMTKVFAYWQTVNHRESYDMFGCNGILFNHESPCRGETFVTRKITRAVGRTKMNETPFTIVAFGNSITAAIEVAPEKRWTSLLQAALPIRVQNFGVGGNTSREGLARISEALVDCPQLVLVEFGGNDTTHEAERHVLLAEFSANLEQMRAAIANLNAVMVLLVFPPVVDEWTVHNQNAFHQQKGGVDAHVELYRQATRNFAHEKKLPLIEIDRTLREAGRQHGWAQIFQTDGVHLTEIGNRLIFETVRQALTAMPQLSLPDSAV